MSHSREYEAWAAMWDRMEYPADARYSRERADLYRAKLEAMNEQAEKTDD